MSSDSPARKKLKERAWTIFFTLAITLVFGATVSALHVATQERVAQNEKLFLQRALRQAAGLPKLPDAELPQWFVDSVAVDPAALPPRYTVQMDEGDKAVQVVERSGAGLWGTIRLAVGIATDLDGISKLTGIAVLEQGETPGLGARIGEPWYSEQMRGKFGQLKRVPEGTRSEQNDEIDGITGATITVVAVQDILNRVLTEHDSADGEQGRAD